MRGFIQISIFIAIIVAAVLGGGAYVTYKETIRPSQNATASSTLAVKAEVSASISPNISAAFNDFDAALSLSAGLRKCPATTCEIIRYYAETAVVHIKKESVDGKWYQVKAKDDDGTPLEGWIAKSAFTSKSQSSRPPISDFNTNQQTQNTNSVSATNVQPQQKNSGIFCKGAYYNACTTGQFYCPASGEAKCLIAQQNSSLLDALAKQLEQWNEQQKQSETNRQQVLQELAQQFQEKHKPCDDWSKQIDANVVLIKAEISAAGGFGTESQVLAMAIQRAGNSPAQCGGFSSGYTSSYSSTHCNYLNGGLDCISSDGSRMQASPMPGGSGFNISSW